MNIINILQQNVFMLVNTSEYYKYITAKYALCWCCNKLKWQNCDMILFTNVNDENTKINAVKKHYSIFLLLSG